MYRYNEFGGGRQREFSQAGIELLGSNSPEADAEVIATAIAAALSVGIEDLQVSIGQVAFFHGVLAEWQIEGEEAELLPHLIDTRQLVAIEELAERLALPDNARKVITRLASGCGTAEDIDDLERLGSHPVALGALRNLREVLGRLADEDCLRYISVDLGMLQSINYYTGIIFKGFTYGLGFPLFSGGRYDSLVQTFGRNLSATGFSIGVSLALTALQRQGQAIQETALPVWIGYAAGQRAAALRLAEQLRREGKAVICDCNRLDRDALLRQSPGPVLWLDQQGSAHWIREDN